MNQTVNPIQSRKFIRVLIALAMIWIGVGLWVFLPDRKTTLLFAQLFLFSFLDLVFLVLIFWKVFFNASHQKSKMPQIIIFVTFKLVCLGFLAITLKRLENAPFSLVFMGVGFVGIGPMLTGLWLSRSRLLRGRRKTT